MITATNAVGETRTPTKVWPNGSYNCPFCHQAVIIDGPVHQGSCANPWCTAHPQMSREVAQAQIDREAERVAEERIRAQYHVSAMARIKENKERAAEQYRADVIEAEETGICLACLTSYSRKRTKHRKPENCPKRRDR